MTQKLNITEPYMENFHCKPDSEQTPAPQNVDAEKYDALKTVAQHLKDTLNQFNPAVYPNAEKCEGKLLFMGVEYDVKLVPMVFKNGEMREPLQKYLDGQNSMMVKGEFIPNPDFASRKVVTGSDEIIEILESLSNRYEVFGGVYAIRKTELDVVIEDLRTKMGG